MLHCFITIWTNRRTVCTVSCPAYFTLAIILVKNVKNTLANRQLCFLTLITDFVLIADK